MAAQQTPEGRARIALAAALHHLPDWRPEAQEPDPDDHAARQQAMHEWLADPRPFVTPARFDREAATADVAAAFPGRTRSAAPGPRGPARSLHFHAGRARVHTGEFLGDRTWSGEWTTDAVALTDGRRELVGFRHRQGDGR